MRNRNYKVFGQNKNKNKKNPLNYILRSNVHHEKKESNNRKVFIYKKLNQWPIQQKNEKNLISVYSITKGFHLKKNNRER